MLRSLLVLTTAAGVGLAPALVPAPQTVTVDAPAAVAVPADAGTDAAVETTVEEVPMVVVPAEEAVDASGDDAALRAPDADAPAATADPADEPTVAPTPEPSASVRPGDGTVVADELVDGDRVVTPAVEVADAQTVGVTWPAGAEGEDLGVEVRYRTDGAWSDWIPLDASDAVPDDGTADAAHQQRGGTDSYWVGDADSVQLSFAATADGGPADLSLALIGSAEADLPDGGAAVEDAVTGGPGTGDAVVRTAAWTTTTAAVVQTAAQPGIVTRAQWGARAQACQPDVAPRLEGAVVHHTAGSNLYTTQAQAMQQIRNDQAYHINTRGWCDIGYNFIVDKWGNIYEGRANSLTQAVIGVHATNANTGTVGVSMLGNYDITPTTPAMIDAVGRIIGWRLGNYGLDPHGSGLYPSGYVLPRVIGHRDAPNASTACPGRYGHAQLPNIRAIAAANPGLPLMPRSTAESLVKALYVDLLGRPVDASGLATWSAQLVSGREPAVVVEALTQSREYRRARIDAAYREVFGRAADAAGLDMWTAEVASGRVLVDDVKRRLLDSGEFFSRAGGTPQGYVTRMYQSVLQRDPSAAEVESWSARWGSLGRSGIAGALWGSREVGYRRVEVYYPLLLGRAVDRGGLETWSTVLLRQGEAAVRNGLAASGEYRNRAVSRFPS